jgi:hypothetical protein
MAANGIIICIACKISYVDYKNVEELWVEVGNKAIPIDSLK